MAEIDEFTFGSIVFKGEKQFRDILTFADDTVNKRKADYGKESKLVCSVIL